MYASALKPEDPIPINKHVVEVGDLFELPMNWCHDFAGQSTEEMRKYKAIERLPRFMLCESRNGPKASYHIRAIDYFTLQNAHVLSQKGRCV